jgi:hypothetical protein
MERKAAGSCMAGHTLIGLKINSHPPEVGLVSKNHTGIGTSFANQSAGVIAGSSAHFPAAAGTKQLYKSQDNKRSCHL